MRKNKKKQKKIKMKDITETKEKILANLDNKSIQEVFYGYVLKAERKFIDSLKDLKNFNDDCDCEEGGDEAQMIKEGDSHFGDAYVVVTRCLICGGYMNEEGFY